MANGTPLVYGDSSKDLIDLSLFGYAANLEIEYRLPDDSMVVSVFKGKYGISYPKGTSSSALPIAFYGNFGASELYTGNMERYFNRIFTDFRPLAHECRAIDLRNARLLSEFYDLDSMFPNLELLGLSMNSLGNYAPSQLTFPENLNVLILEGFCVNKDLMDNLSEMDSLKMLILVDCWSDTVWFPFFADTIKNRISSFAGVSQQLKYFLLIGSSEMVFLDFLRADWPNLEGGHFDVTHGFVNGPHSCLGYFDKNHRPGKNRFPVLDHPYFTFSYLEEQEGKLLLRLKKQKFFTVKKESIEATKARITEWGRKSTERDQP